MSKISFIFIFFIFLTVCKYFWNEIVQITGEPLMDIQYSNIQASCYKINHLLDSKIEGMKIVFLSTTLLEERYNSDQDHIIHLAILDLASSQRILYNDFLKISLYHPFSTLTNAFYISKILAVDPLIIYINSSIIK